MKKYPVEDFVLTFSSCMVLSKAEFELFREAIANGALDDQDKYNKHWRMLITYKERFDAPMPAALRRALLYGD